MATHWTYDATKFASTDPGYYSGSTIGVRMRVRLLLQDTNSSRQLFQDEEIDWQQTQEMNEFIVTASLAEILVAKAGAVKNKKIGDLSITYDPKFYLTLASTMRARGASYQVPYAGGISQGDKLAQQLDPDWVAPSFARNLDNNPTAPGPQQVPPNPITNPGF